MSVGTLPPVSKDEEEELGIYEDFGEADDELIDTEPPIAELGRPQSQFKLRYSSISRIEQVLGSSNEVLNQRHSEPRQECTGGYHESESCDQLKTRDHTNSAASLDERILQMAHDTQTIRTEQGNMAT